MADGTKSTTTYSLSLETNTKYPSRKLWNNTKTWLFQYNQWLFKGERSFIEELTGMIATKTKDEIEKHENWYTSYLSLNELKKKAIKEWKEKKNVRSSETKSVQ